MLFHDFSDKKGFTLRKGLRGVSIFAKMESKGGEEMKKSFAMLLALGVIAQAGETKTEERQIPVVKCSEPVNSIMVMEFDCKAGACQQPNNPKLLPIFEVLTTGSGIQGLGKGVSTMLTNALKATNCFNPTPQEVSIFCKVEMNCERLDSVLILVYTNRCPDNQGT